MALAALAALVLMAQLCWNSKLTSLPCLISMAIGKSNRIRIHHIRKCRIVQEQVQVQEE
jgi:hypothetical protein